MRAATIAVEVVYALPERQTLLRVDVARAGTLGDALAASGILSLHPEIDLMTQRVGVFGQFAGTDRILEPGDRIEIYRPLVAEPKASRHARVARKRAERDSDRNMRA